MGALLFPGGAEWDAARENSGFGFCCVCCQGGAGVGIVEEEPSEPVAGLRLSTVVARWFGCIAASVNPAKQNKKRKSNVMSVWE